jgi:hypothetical protein
MVNPARDDLAMTKNSAKIVDPSEGVEDPTLLYSDATRAKKADKVSKTRLWFIAFKALDQSIQIMVR